MSNISNTTRQLDPCFPVPNIFFNLRVNFKYYLHIGFFLLITNQPFVLFLIENILTINPNPLVDHYKSSDVEEEDKGRVTPMG